MAGTFKIVQSAEDRNFERRYSVYIRSCKVIDTRRDVTEFGREVRTNLHYLDACKLKRMLEARPDDVAQVIVDCAMDMSTSGYASARELLDVVGSRR